MMETILNNKKSITAKATTLLAETDWTDLSTLRNPSNENHLVNYNEFHAYRLQLMAIAVNPPVTVDAWPVKPVEVWAY
jgi:hypothetical protein